MNTEFIKVPNESPDRYLNMPEGLDGYWWETDRLICIPFIENRNEGNGAFGQWLMELESKGKMIFFPTVISARLDAILRRRGYQDAITEKIDKDFGCHIEGLALDRNRPGE